MLRLFLKQGQIEEQPSSNWRYNMQNIILPLITEYRLLIMTALMLFFILLTQKKKGSKKVLRALTVILAMSITYELVAHEPASRIPGRIHLALNQPGPTESSNTHYYIDPEKRYNFSN